MQVAELGERAARRRPTVLGDHQSLGTQFLHCLADCHPGDPEMINQRGLGGQTSASF
ncbi:hypothetical protein BZL29_1629 [Mycobacterium kansasii]|uniref:Uncharacterized protein n=1 Tax=Mycobacterium kansasii TaxID=1768 RepID=A0A1V3XYK2_MYCKA|nr:hypothetical protein BZL29_1629 [Mycobacterium kansasii]